MIHHPLDRRICDVAIDGNALDRDGSDHDALVDRVLALCEAGTINLIVPKGVRFEISNPKTRSLCRKRRQRFSRSALG